MQKHRLKRKRFYTLSIVAAVGLLPSLARACAVCWGGDDALAHGLNVSIAFLMSMPFLIGGTVFSVLYVAQKRAQGERWPDILTKNFARTQKENQS
jgi:hypothetical protein